VKYRYLLIVCLLFIACGKKNDDSKVKDILNSVCTTTSYEGIKKEAFGKIISSNLFDNYNNISTYILSGQKSNNPLSILSFEICNKYIVLLCEQSNKNFTIKDLIVIETLKNEILVLNNCELNGSKNDNIVAIAYKTDGEYLSDIRKAWKINREEYIIQEIKVDSIKCLNEEYGL